MKNLLYLFGFLPSVIWLLFYLKKDKHPEPNRMIVKIFLYGMLAALVAVFLEKGFQSTHGLFTASPSLDSLLAIFLGGALIEEMSKYLAVWLGVYRNRELDEPTDLVLYMIISALGFAAMENIFVLANYHPILSPTTVLEIMSIRFLSATFLHALCSGLFGYFLAMSFFYSKRRKLFFFAGLAITTILHGAYNYSIMKISGSLKFLLPVIIIISLSCFVSYSFKRLKKMQSTCQIS